MTFPCAPGHTPAPDSDNAKVFPKASIFNALNASDELLGGEVPVKGCTW